MFTKEELFIIKQLILRAQINGGDAHSVSKLLIKIDELISSL